MAWGVGHGVENGERGFGSAQPPGQETGEGKTKKGDRKNGHNRNDKWYSEITIGFA